MSKQLDWDAYRYVLDDPTLDRAVFEARMLDDIELALAVAEAVLHIDTLRTASFMATRLQHSASSARLAASGGNAAASGGWNLSSLAALAAAMLLAIGVVSYRIQKVLPGPVAESRAVQQNLAESWLAIRQTELVDVSSNLVDVSTNFEPPRDDETFVDAESAEDDWLIDAAREFYAQGEAS